MNRRSLLRMLGLAPVAACSAALPAIALPKPENVKNVVNRAGFFIEAKSGGHHSKIGVSAEYPIDLDALTHDLDGALRWTGESTRYVLAELDRIKNV
jgi:hypothetical protein